MQLPINKIVYCDCIEFLKSLPDGCIDLIFADPPFNYGKNYGLGNNDLKNNYYDWCEEWISECFRVLADTGSFYLMSAYNRIARIQITMEKFGIHRNTIIWRRSYPPMKRKYVIKHQPILFFTKSNHYIFNRYAEEYHYDARDAMAKRGTEKFQMPDVWEDIKYISGGCCRSKESILGNHGKSKAHPCQMPEKLADRIIKFSSNPGDIVFDPFMGSGTTAVVAERLKRRWIGCEINKEYITLSYRRLGREHIPNPLSYTKNALLCC